MQVNEHLAALLLLGPVFGSFAILVCSFGEPRGHRWKELKREWPFYVALGITGMFGLVVFGFGLFVFLTLTEFARPKYTLDGLASAERAIGHEARRWCEGKGRRE